MHLISHDIVFYFLLLLQFSCCTFFDHFYLSFTYVLSIPISTSSLPFLFSSFFFFLNDTPPPEIYPLPLHAALPICPNLSRLGRAPKAFGAGLLARRSEGAHRALTGTQNLLLLADVVPNSRWWNASTLVGRTTHPQIGRAHV